MKKLLIWSLLLTGSLLCACTSDDDSKESKDELGSIYGIVTELGTAEPMKAVGVELYKKKYEWSDEYDLLLLKTVTFDDGHFEFKDLNPENYKVKVVADGYEQTEEGNVTVEAGRQARIDLQVKKQDVHAKAYTANAVVSGNQVILNGEYTKDYYYNVSEAGFVYATNNNPQNGGTKVKCKIDEIKEVNSAYKLSTTISNLPYGTTYYFQAYATTEYGTAYGEILSFSISGNPAVSTLDVSNITKTTATLNGRIDYEGNPAYTERGFVYSKLFPRPTVEDASDATTKISVSGRSEDFSANVSSLTENTLYYVRAYATNVDGTVYGEVKTFRPGQQDYVIIDNLMVQTKDLGKSNWSSAKQMCMNSRIGGYSDWRLPTLAELSILYANKEEIGGFTSEGYWSSTEGYDWAYYINFSTGNHGTPYKSSQYYVRAVRTIN